MIIQDLKFTRLQRQVSTQFVMRSCSFVSVNLSTTTSRLKHGVAKDWESQACKQSA